MGWNDWKMLSIKNCNMTKSDSTASSLAKHKRMTKLKQVRQKGANNNQIKWSERASKMKLIFVKHIPWHSCSNVAFVAIDARLADKSAKGKRHTHNHTVNEWIGVCTSDGIWNHLCAIWLECKWNGARNNREWCLLDSSQ